MRNQRLYVYGTLKTGQYFYPRYLEGQSDFLGPATASKEFSLYVAPLPYLIKEPTDVAVKGELFMIDVDTLARIDALEAHPTVYKRELIDVHDESGEKVLAWAYLFPTHFKGKSEDCKEVEFV